MNFLSSIRSDRIIDIATHTVPTFARILGFIALLAGFSINFWSSAPSQVMQNMKYESESLIYGRLNLVRAQGFFSGSGHLGWTVEEWGPMMHAKEYDHLRSGTTGPSWRPYTAQIGLQGIFLSAIDRYMPAEGATRIAIYKFIFAAATALVLVWIASQVAIYLGWAGFSGFIVGALASPWLTMFGGNLYFVLALSFLPTAVAFHVCKNLDARKRTGCKFALLLFVAFFLKFACGYEYTSTVILAATIPPVIVGLTREWSATRFLGVILLIIASAIAAFAVALALQAVQSGGLESLLLRANRRVVSGAYALDIMTVPDWMAFLAPRWSVLVTSLFADPVFPGLSTPGFLIASAVLVAVTVGVTQNSWIFGEKRVEIVAGAAAVIVAVAAAVSWIILAKPHSYVHPHLIPIIWSLPFWPVAGAFGAAIVWALVTNIGMLMRHPAAATLASGVMLAPWLVFSIFYFDGIKKPFELVQLNRLVGSGKFLDYVDEHGVEITHSPGLIVFSARNCSLLPPGDTMVLNRPESSRRPRLSLCAAVRTRRATAFRSVRACGSDCRASRCNRTRRLAPCPACGKPCVGRARA